ncbi:hypothetical protein CASFOL_022086 [Castilleja foliolosa]|uniref:Fe2OG dioxygenase domain-containing protein n=1 Tax=Castilleja foliolosa TaxID=1961234 RepID=A0ABD3CZY4_9LAMI
MDTSTLRFLLALVAYVTLGMIIGALIQLTVIGRLDESSGAMSSLTRISDTNGSNLKLTKGVSNWNAEEAITLRIGYVKPEIISWSPRVILFHNFLSVEECDYLISIAKPYLRLSNVVNKTTGKGMRSKVRTSSGMFLMAEDRKYPTIQAIEKRISVYSHVPVENGEFMQVTRYEKNQYYKPHYDYFEDSFNLNRGGQRVATMLMYLSDGVEGGETYFPEVTNAPAVCTRPHLSGLHILVEPTTNELFGGTGECSCGGKIFTGICVKPVKGNALLFWNMGLDGQSDPRSLHGGCEVFVGNVWTNFNINSNKESHFDYHSLHLNVAHGNMK